MKLLISALFFQDFGTHCSTGFGNLFQHKLSWTCFVGILHMKPLPSTLLFLICCLDTVNWSKDGRVKSWVPDIRFESTICAWDEMFDFHMLCTYMYTKLICFCVHGFTPLSGKDFLKQKRIILDCCTVYNHFLGSRDYNKMRLEAEIRFWNTCESPNMRNYNEDRAGGATTSRETTLRTTHSCLIDPQQHPS